MPSAAVGEPGPGQRAAAGGGGPGAGGRDPPGTRPGHQTAGGEVEGGRGQSHGGGSAATGRGKTLGGKRCKLHGLWEVCGLET